MGPKGVEGITQAGRCCTSSVLRKLEERQGRPRVPGDALHGLKECYKIKLRGAGYRLVYRVEDERIVILVLAIGKRERGSVYEQTEKR